MKNISRRHQAILWTNFKLSSLELGNTHLWPISQEIINISIHKMSLKNTSVKLFPHLSGEFQKVDKLPSTTMQTRRHANIGPVLAHYGI